MNVRDVFVEFTFLSCEVLLVGVVCVLVKYYAW